MEQLYYRRVMSEAPLLRGQDADPWQGGDWVDELSEPRRETSDVSKIAKQALAFEAVSLQVIVQRIDQLPRVTYL